MTASWIFTTTDGHTRRLTAGCLIGSTSINLCKHSSTRTGRKPAFKSGAASAGIEKSLCLFQIPAGRRRRWTFLAIHKGNSRSKTPRPWSLISPIPVICPCCEWRGNEKLGIDLEHLGRLADYEGILNIINSNKDGEHVVSVQGG